MKKTYSFLLVFALFVSNTFALAQQTPNVFDRFDAPSLPRTGNYGGSPSGTELKPAIIPTAFQGEWNDPIKDCGTGRSDMRLRIGASIIRFYESEGEVRRVIRHNNRAITVLASYSGEGQVWDRVDRLVLSGSGNDLTVQSGDDSVTRQRCPIRKVRK